MVVIFLQFRCFYNITFIFSHIRSSFGWHSGGGFKTKVRKKICLPSPDFRVLKPFYIEVHLCIWFKDWFKEARDTEEKQQMADIARKWTHPFSYLLALLSSFWSYLEPVTLCFSSVGSWETLTFASCKLDTSPGLQKDGNSQPGSYKLCKVWCTTPQQMTSCWQEWVREGPTGCVRACSAPIKFPTHADTWRKLISCFFKLLTWEKDGWSVNP